MSNESNTANFEANPFIAMRGFMRKRANVERCELCSAELASQHQHLLDVASRQMVCACLGCSLLFDAPATMNLKFRRIPRDVRDIPGFQLTDSQWDALAIPIGMAFFFENQTLGKFTAIYPSPAGPTESLLDLDSWHEIVADNPVLTKMQPDVEALLANRIPPVHEYFVVPIDECYKLVGLIRASWRGLHGGELVWEKINQFFDDLKGRAIAPPKVQHA